MNIKEFSSPNYSEESIDPQFIIIHYTGGNHKRAHGLFMNSEKKVSCHYMITTKGEIINYVRVEKNHVLRAWHAGISFWADLKTTLWTDLNSYSIGIELENLNGNIIPYSIEQIQSLNELLTHLFAMFPNLNCHERILGHENISGFRGKCDPGILFPWKEVYKINFPKEKHIFQKAICPIEIADTFKKYLTVQIEGDENMFNSFWHAINANLEKTISSLFCNNI